MEGARHRIVIEGVAATVRLGYQCAARLGAWKLDGEWFLAAVLDVDAFRITQGPLVLEITNKDGPPTRRALSDVSVIRGQLSARVGRRAEI